MINLLIGPPGGGKSYEATVFHILPALAAGRLVITNLPLDLDRLRQIDPGFPALVQMVENRRGTIRIQATRFAPAKHEEGIIRAFATIADYAHPWRHPTSGAGPLYVIDECHLAMPRGGTDIAVEEWFSLHRHESADVLLITQSYGKVSRSIVDLVQVCYRVKKGTAFGTATKYIRKVQDGVRGEVVNTSIRTYEKRYFGLYKSHTRGGGSELAANDIVPIWKRWPFIGAAAMILLSVGIFTFSGAQVLPTGMKETAKAPANPVHNPVQVASKPAQVEVPKPVIRDSDDAGLPYHGRGLHVVGTIVRDGVARVLFAVSQNGQYVSDVDSRDLTKLGYKVDAETPCAVRVSHGTWSKWVICDAPQVALAVGAPNSGERAAATQEKTTGGTRATGAGGSLSSDSLGAPPSPDSIQG